MDISLLDPNYAEMLKARDALYQVMDPELMVNIIDLGLVYDIQFVEQKLHVLMTLSTPYCPMGESIVAGVHHVLETTFPEHEIEVNLTFDPPWNHERISPEGRLALGISN